MSAKRVLIISYYWPPASGPGVQRILKFAKFLPEFGWEPTVLTVRNGSYPNTDDSLLEEVKDVKVIRTKTLEPFAIYNSLQGKKGKSVPVAMQGIKDSKSPFQKLAKYIRANLFIPDARMYWRGYAVKEARRILQEDKFDAIITSGPPHSSHLIGLDLKKEFGIPWIADFRDPWTGIYYNKFLPRSKRTQEKDKALEDLVLDSADSVIAISKTFSKQLEDRAKHAEVILNGFDPGDMPEPKEVKNEKFRLGYIGNFKPNQDVPVLWGILKDNLESDPGFKYKFELLLAGNVDPHIESKLNSMGLGSILKRMDFMPHDEAVKTMQSCDALLFIIPDSDDNELILTGKIFEYLAIRRPIFSIGPKGGDADHLLQEMGRGEIIDYDDASTMNARLDGLTKQWQEKGSLNNLSNDGLDRLTRKASTEELSRLLDKISA